MKDTEKLEALKKIAPGTAFREGLENILRAKTGAIIIVGDDEEINTVVDGGFNINADFSPAYLYELAKMDGAIIVSRDCKKIRYANAQLVPDSSISTKETGTRHRTAERVAKQTNEMVISISQRRNIITLYKGHGKYVISDISKILSKANQAVQTLDKYKSVSNQAMINLSALEFENYVTLYDVISVLQKAERVVRIVGEIENYIIELGSEGRLVSMQLQELVGNVKEDLEMIFKDYNINQELTFDGYRELMKKKNSDELIDMKYIAELLGYGQISEDLDLSLYPKGYRILNKIPRLPSNVIENLVNDFEGLQKIVAADIKALDDVEGIGEVRALSIRNGLKRIKEQVLFDRHI